MKKEAGLDVMKPNDLIGAVVERVETGDATLTLYLMTRGGMMYRVHSDLVAEQQWVPVSLVDAEGDIPDRTPKHMIGPDHMDGYRVPKRTFQLGDISGLDVVGG